METKATDKHCCKKIKIPKHQPVVGSYENLLFKAFPISSERARMKLALEDVAGRPVFMLVMKSVSIFTF